MKYFVFADVHGFYNEFIKELNKLGFDENDSNHMLISLGDNFDRGPDNYKMFKFLKEMKEKNKIILIRGNHEDLIIQMLQRREVHINDISNGTYGTIMEFSKHYFNHGEMFYKSPDMMYMRLKEDGFLDLIYEMLPYYETNNYIFTHGFIPVIYDYHKGYIKNDDWRNSTYKEFSDSRWFNGMEMVLKYNITDKKKFVVGHWHSSYGHVRMKYGIDIKNEEARKYEFSNNEYFKPFINDNIIALDACTGFSKMVNVFIIED